jgi:hypothetical protein
VHLFNHFVDVLTKCIVGVATFGHMSCYHTTVHQATTRNFESFALCIFNAININFDFIANLQISFLAGGCEFAQGYAFGRPITAADARKLVGAAPDHSETRAVAE